MSITLSFYPDFNDQTVLDDHFFRALWFLAPYKDRISEVIFPCKPGLQPPSAPPAWLDPAFKMLTGTLQVRFQTVLEANEFDQAIAAADGILLWSQDHVNAPCLKGKQIVRIDHENVRHAASFYLLIHERFPQFQMDNLARSKEVFERIRQRCTSDVGYVFGTGPGLSLALERGFDFSDGVCIACNSMVRNQELMTRIKPPLIAVADPIFHAGPSSYAAAFREELIRALDQFDADLIVPMRDYGIYLHHMPERFTNRIAALPFIKGQTPNLDLTEKFHVTTTANILTLFLLPLAATFFKQTRILGCDGRPMDANTYFWSHDKASQFNDKMDDIQKAHPAFFNIDYDDYYLTHCETLETWLDAMEENGRRVNNYTPSHIPALQKRTIEYSPNQDLCETTDHYSNKVVVSIDPEVGSSNGHYLPLNMRSREVALKMGIEYIIAGNRDTSKLPKDNNFDFILPIFDCNTWAFRKRDIGERAGSYEKFESGLQILHDYLMDNYNERELHLVMYCGSMSAAEALYERFREHKNVHLSVHLMWCCFINYRDNSFVNRWKGFVHEFLSEDRNNLFGSTQTIASGLSEIFGANIRTVPHVTPTYSDSDIIQILERAEVDEVDKKKVLSFPALPNVQKGVDLRNELLWAVASDPELSGYILQVRGEVPEGLNDLIDLDVWPVELSDMEYRELVSSATVAVQLYLPETFADRSSALLLDLITNRIPVVCTPGSWVAQFVTKYGCGCVAESFENEDIIVTIKEALRSCEDFRRNARSAALDWNRENNWFNFVRLYCLGEGKVGANPAGAFAIPTSVQVPEIGVKNLERGFAGLRDQYRGKRCFILGNGPSLNKHDLSLLEGEYVFGVNGIFYKTDETAFRPTFFVVEDSKVMEENIDRIKAYDVPHKFFPSIYKALHPQGENVHFFNMNRGFYEKSSPNYCVPRFSTDASKVLYCGQSVTYINLQLAFFMGFSEVYLIGMDFDYVIPKEHERRGDLIVSTTDDPNHFHKDYFGKGKTWKDPKLDRVAMNYRQAKLSFEAVGRRIYNATIGGKLEIFPRVDYEALLRDPATGLKRIEQAAPVLLTPGEGGRQLPARAISHTPQAPQIAISASPAPAIKKEAIPVHSSTERTSAEIRAAKLAKLKRDPHAFFRDSHIAPLRLLHYFFKPATISKWQADMEKQARHEAGGVFSFLPASRKRLAQSRAALKSESSRSEAMLRTELARIQRDFQARETALNNELARARREADEREARSRSEMKAVEDELRQQAAASEQRLTAATEGLAAMETALHNELARARREADEREARSRSEMKAVEDELRQQAAASEQRLTAATEGLAAVETALRAEITDAQDAMKSNFSEQVAAVRTERNEQAEEIRKLGEGLDLSVKKEIASIRNSFDQEKRISAPANAAIWRVHDRHLSQADITHIQQNWLRPLGLFLSPRQLGYIAHHIGLAEERCEGRMATTIQAAMLRTLALLSLQAEEIDLLEIGTLFGIGGGTLYQAGMRAQRKMRLTLLDPLDGYYGQRLTDDMTGVPITRDTLVRNLQTLAVPEEDYRIIQHLSTKQEAIEAASERSYDYLLIDGDHSLEGVAADFELYGPMVKPGGVVIFDDYATTDWPAIQTFVDEHVRGNDDWLWIGGEWRTAILRRKRRASATAPDRTKAPAATGQ